MTRFYYILIVAVVLIAISALLKNFILLVVTFFLFLAIIFLGVLIPRLSLFGNFICGRKNPQQRYVALTFDDGPDANSTPVLLDLLAKLNIKATFFCIGKNVAAHPELAARIVHEGHLLENHSYHHSYMTNCFTPAKLQTELTQAQTIIQQATGITPQYFRPPMGFSNPHIFSAAKKAGLAVIGWNARGYDTQTIDAQRIAARIMRRVKSGAIILLHDGKANIECLTAIVILLSAKLHEHQYEVVRLDELLK
jgi:peptidoglycan-N-acetylglucosamine deacetylase